ncbi:MAG: hypothetical protein QOE26_1632 [Verrucomicrobiota bacterium]
MLSLSAAGSSSYLLLIGPYVAWWHIASFRCTAEFGPLPSHSGLWQATARRSIDIGDCQRYFA